MKKILVPVFGLLLCTNALAQETQSSSATAAAKENTAKEVAVPASSLRANLKRAALELSSTSVKHAREYQDSPNSKLNADSETVIKGVFDFVLEYERKNFQWNNGLFMEYGKTTLKPAEGEKTSTENADKILFTSDYNQKVWNYKGADIGPFAQLQYQTEFTTDNGTPRTKTLRGMAGLKLFNGTYIKSLYAGIVEEADFTYSKTNMKTAYEVGLEVAYPVRDGVSFALESYYRDYMTYSRYEGTNFRYEFNLTSRLDVKLNNKLSMAPYISYFRAKDRQSKVYGSNFMVGISFAYSSIFNLFD